MYLLISALVPVDGVAGDHEALHVYSVDVSLLCSHVHPRGSHRCVTPRLGWERGREGGGGESGQEGGVRGKAVQV